MVNIVFVLLEEQRLYDNLRYHPHGHLKTNCPQFGGAFLPSLGSTALVNSDFLTFSFTSRTIKYLHEAAVTRLCAIGGFFVSIPVFLTGTITIKKSLPQPLPNVSYYFAFFQE